MSELETITLEDVERSVSRARASLADAALEVVWQIENEAWTVLGHNSWDEMREAQYGGAAFMVPRSDRLELVGRLRDAGLSQREIARTAGVAHTTIQKDVADICHPEPEEPPMRRSPTRPGVTTWSRRVQNVSAKCPMGELSTEEIEELLGAATFLRDYCRGELIGRREGA